MQNEFYARPQASTQVNFDVGLREHMNQIYRTMGVGMLITALSAWLIYGLSVTAVNGNRQFTAFGDAVFASPLKWVIAFAPLVLIFMAGTAMRKLSPAGLKLAFYGVAALMGVSMSTLLLVFTGGSIATAFLATAAGFAGLSLFGYTTQKDLSGLGSFLLVGVIGLIVVMIANIFIQSSVIMLAVSAIGVLVFAGLTAYDTQRAKAEYITLSQTGVGQDELSKLATMSALSLYLDFVNMFQFLLNFIRVRE